MNSRKSFSLIVISLAALAGLSACSLAADVTPPAGYVAPTPVPTTAPVYPASLPNPDDGAGLYATNCAACHGETGLGDGSSAADLPVAPPAIGSAQVASSSKPLDWYQIITDGNLSNYMPGYATDLSDSQRWDVLSYVYSLSATNQQIADGKTVYDEKCASCHGTSGAGDGAQAASLSTSPANLTDAVAMSQLSSADVLQAVSQGVSPDMPAFQGQLSEDQLQSVTDFTRTLWLGTAGAEQTAANASANTSATETVSATPAADGTAAAVSAIGTVQGTVTNGSGGSIPTGADVTLHGYDTMDETVTLTTKLADDGTFQFSDVEMPADRIYMTSVDYNGITFTSQMGQATTDSTSLDLSLVVYETSTDASALTADRLHVIYTFPDAGTVQVVEMLIVSNPTNNVIIPASADSGVLTFDLPEGATNLQFDSGTLGGRYLQTEKGFSDTEPIYPGSGEHQVLFAFDLPYEDGLQFNQALPLDVAALVVMVPDVGVSINSDLLTFSGNRTMQNTQYAVYTANGLKGGDVFPAELTGKAAVSDSASLASSNSMLDILIGLGVLGLTLIGAGVWFLRRRGQAQTAVAEISAEAAGGETSAKDSDTLIDEIIALDDLYRSGKLSEKVYRERRAELKSQLKDKME